MKKNKLIEQQSPNTSQSTNSYYKCLCTFKDAALNEVTKRFPLEPRRIVDEILDGVNTMLDNAILVGIFTQSGILLVKCLDYFLQSNEALWRQSSEEFDINQLNFQKYFLPIAFLVVLSAPIIEEIRFRGITTPGIKYLLKKIGLDEEKAQRISSLISSVYFGSLHSKKSFLGATAMAHMTHEPLVAKHHGSLWGTIAAHMANNALALTGTVVSKTFHSLTGW